MVLPDRPMVDHDLVGSPAISRNLSQPGSPPFGTSSVDSRCPTSIWFDQSSSNRYRLRPVDGRALRCCLGPVRPRCRCLGPRHNQPQSGRSVGYACAAAWCWAGTLSVPCPSGPHSRFCNGARHRYVKRNVPDTVKRRRCAEWWVWRRHSDAGVAACVDRLVVWPTERPAASSSWTSSVRSSDRRTGSSMRSAIHT